MKEWKYFVIANVHRYCGRVLFFIGKNLCSESTLIAANNQMDKGIENMTIFRDFRVK